MADFKITVEEVDEKDLAQVWSRFQEYAIYCPYQCAEWLLTWHLGEHASDKMNHKFFLIYVDGVPAFFFPLLVKKVFGIKTCQWLGGKIQNMNGPLVSTDWKGDGDPIVISAIFEQISSMLGGIDLILLERNLLDINGLQNPLLGFGTWRIHKDQLYYMQMPDNFDTFERLQRSSSSRRRLRTKIKLLAQELGTPVFQKAENGRDVELFLNAFFEQRIAAQKSRNIPNPFFDPKARAFLLQSGLASLRSKNGLHIFALLVAEKICSVSLNVHTNGYSSGFATSFDTDFSRFSPSKLLKREVIRLRHKDGIRRFDLGIGDEDYKLEWTQPIDLFDVYYARTVRGKIAQFALLNFNALIKKIKQQKILRKAVNKIRIVFCAKK